MTSFPEFDLEAGEIARYGRLAGEAIARQRDSLLSSPVFDRIGPLSQVFEEDLPEEGAPFEDVLDFVARNALPRTTGSAHPRYYGFVNSTADPVGVVADYLAAAMNTNCWGGDHAANHIEKAALRWLAELLGLPETSEGVLVSGGSAGTLTALAAARQEKSPGDVREDGVAAGGPKGLTVFASDQVHSCVDKAVDLLGIGTKQLRKIPADADFRLPVDRLAEAVARDRREDLWLHVDGAYGALARLSPRLAPLFSGLEHADSVVADPHKWLFVPFAAGAAFVRGEGRLARAFRRFPEYLDTSPEAPLSGPVWFAERGIELSRSFRALKIWMGLKVHGWKAYAEVIEKNVDLARVLSEEVDRREDLERLSDPVLSIVNFRYRPPRRALAESALNELNRRIVYRVVEEGSAFVYPTVLRGKTAIRVCIVNFRTTERDLAALLDDVERIGRREAE